MKNKVGATSFIYARKHHGEEMQNEMLLTRSGESDTSRSNRASSAANL
jgi:hypothetical protein